MSATIILAKDLSEITSCDCSIQERKIIGSQHEKTPLKEISSIVNWTYKNAVYGCSIPERPHIGFEIFTYVLHGVVEISNKTKNEKTLLIDGDSFVTNASKGVLLGKRLRPRTELLQIWLKPNSIETKKNDSLDNHYQSEQHNIQGCEYSSIRKLFGKDAPFQLSTENTSIEIVEYFAGFHNLDIPENTILCAYVLDGYVEVDDQLLGKNDFFKIENETDYKLISLINSKLLFVYTALQPEYAMVEKMNIINKLHHF